MNTRLFTDLCVAVAISVLGLLGLYQSRQIKSLEGTLAVEHKIAEFMLQELQELKSPTKQ